MSHFPVPSFPKPPEASTSKDSKKNSLVKMKGKLLPKPVDGQISLSAIFSTSLFKKDFPIDSCALIQNGQMGLTFRQLDDVSRRVARTIASKIALIAPSHKKAPTNSDGDSVVAILTKESIIDERIIVFILAILKLGATYVNIKPSQLIDEGDWKRMIRKVQPLIVIVADDYKMAQMITNTGGVLCSISRSDIKQKIKLPHQVWTSAELWEEAVKIRQEDAHDISVSPLWSKVPVGDRTAGVFPCTVIAGNVVHWVRICHRAIYNRIYWEKVEFPIQEQEKLYLTYPISDSRALVQIFMALCMGKSLQILDPYIFSNPPCFRQQIAFWKIFRLNLSPDQLENLIDFVDATRTQADLSSVRLWMVSGGHFSLELGHKFFNTYPKEFKCLLSVFYGCPEVLWAATWCTYANSKELTKQSYNGKVNMGTPLHNTRICIVDDKQWQDCAQGVKGEVCISGASMAAGQGIEVTTGTMFQTGDLGRLIQAKRGHNMLIIEGKTNSRIKVNGKTVDLIELAETIERMNIAQQCVLFSAPRTRDSQSIVVAYVPTSSDHSGFHVLSHVQINKDVKILEPSVDACIPISKIPHLHNGQIDYRQLRREYHKYLTSSSNLLWNTLKIDSKLDKEAAKILIKAVASSIGLQAKVVIENFTNSFWRLGGTSTHVVRAISASKAQGFILTPEDFVLSGRLDNLVDRMVMAKKKDSIWKKSVAEVKSLIKYEEMGTKHWRDVIKLIKYDYDAKVPAYVSGLDRFWKKALDEIMSLHISVVAIMDKKVVGVAVNCKAFPKLINVPSEMSVVLGLLHKVTEVCRSEVLSKLVGKLAKSFYIAIDQTGQLTEAQKVLVTRDILDQSFIRSKSIGCGSFLICTANPLVQEVCTFLLNYKSLLELPMNRYKTQGFEKPFWDKDDHEKVGVYFKSDNNKASTSKEKKSLVIKKNSSNNNNIKDSNGNPVENNKD